MLNVEYSVQKQISNFMYAVYAWVAAGLAITTITSYGIASTPEVFSFFYKNPILLLGIMFGQFALIASFSMLLQRINFFIAMFLFLTIAASYGVTFSILFQIYTMSSLTTTFAVTSGTFLVMAAYGYLTKSDLSAIGSIALMLLFGLIIALFINLFLQNQAFDIILSGFGVIIFTLLIAYDTQKIKRLGEELLYHNEMLGKVALLGALMLFLDFINLFIFLLRFLGQRKDR